MKKFSIIIIFALAAHGLTAQDNSDGVDISSELYLQISTLPEAKVGFTQNFKIPFLRLDNPFMSGNNIRFSLTGEITPVSLNGVIKTVLTPVAFLEFTTGGRVGVGWPINLFGSDLYGTGLNLPDTNGSQKYDGEAFDALHLKFFFGGTFQFDFAAIFPGDWNHVVMLSSHEINYQHNTRALDGQGWYYEADDGENRNGWNYFGNIVLGYQMPRLPFFLQMVAFMAEMDLYLDDVDGVDRGFWGDDLVRWTFSNILNFQYTDQLSVALITQLRTRRNFTNFDEHKDKKPHMHYQDRILDKSNPLRLEFYRVASIISYKF
ncbi:MAG: hypothetical protein FWC03_09875 [Treponema sp.]|nr:hypothetical protein [Treponema sp.]